MAVAPETLTWDLGEDDGGARRPSIADLGGATVEDEAPLPDKASMLYADQVNQWAKQLAAFAKIVPSAKISVRFTAGSPAIIAAGGPGTAVVPDLFEVTDNGPGDTTIAWDAGVLPLPTGIQPEVTMNQDGDFSINAVLGTNSVRVKSYTASSGVGADVHFTISIY